MGYTTGPGNELLSDGTYDYTYDPKGNEITKTDIATGDKWTYEYNNANEMTSAVETNSSADVEQTVDYGYDTFGNRTAVEVTAGETTTITRYAYDMWNPAKAGATGTSGSDIWATFTSGGSLTMRELQGDGIDQHLAYVTSSSAYWYLTDHLSSIRAVLDSSGGVTASVAYDAYGNLTTAAAPGLYDWTRREFDVETGLQYNRARYYDPGTGRWISQDPMGFDAGDSNLYRYVTNNPGNSTDPSGLADEPTEGAMEPCGIKTGEKIGPPVSPGSYLTMTLSSFQITQGPQKLADMYGTAGADGKKIYPIDLLKNNNLDFTSIRGQSITIRANIIVKNPKTTGPALSAYAELMRFDPLMASDGTTVNVKVSYNAKFIQVRPGDSSTLTVQAIIDADESGLAGDPHYIIVAAGPNASPTTKGAPAAPFSIEKSFTWVLDAKGK